MTNKQKDANTKGKMLSVEELDAKLREMPDDFDLKKELASALVHRYIYGAGEQGPRNEADIKRVREIIRGLPEDRALYPRAYLAYLDGKEAESTAWLVEFAQYEERTTSFTNDELLDYFMAPFAPSSELLLRLADALNEVHPRSPSVLTLQGFAKLDDNDLEGAIDDFVCALEIDESYWLAAWGCASAYQEEGNWPAARNYYCRALKSETAQGIPDTHFRLAWCLGKLKDYPGEEKHYRSCLEIDPDYPYARNNLGWSLNKQGQYNEALEVFEEAIKRGNDGRFPLRNKANALVKLGRLQEAIEALEQDTYKNGELTRSARKEIARLQELIAKQESGQTLPELVIEEYVKEDELVEKDVGGAPPSKQPLESKQGKKHHDDASKFWREQWLESMIEDMIQKDLPVLGRKLRIYYNPEKGYGRQFAIPRVGRIDLLVEDIDTDDIIVIELKRGQSDDQVIGQTSRYMTWVRENLAEKDQKTFGIICVHRASENLKLSAKNIPGLEIFEYNLNFGIA